MPSIHRGCCFGTGSRFMEHAVVKNNTGSWNMKCRQNATATDVALLFGFFLSFSIII